VVFQDFYTPFFFLQMKQSIYFTAIKDILPGEELKVWYALYYGFKLQALPLADHVSDAEVL